MLLFTAGYNNFEVAEFLLESGADVNAQDKGGLIPLHNASSYGHLDIAALLLKYNTIVNATDKWGFTPLHEGILLYTNYIYDINFCFSILSTAAQKGRTQLCALLLAHGADAFMKNQENQTPIELAAAEDVKCLLQDAMTVSISNQCTNSKSLLSNSSLSSQQSTLVSPTTETVTLPTGASITLSVPVSRAPSRSCLSPAQGAETHADLTDTDINETENVTNVSSFLMR